ncbi:MAG: alanine racemase [Rhodocyclaceae bacterium]
MPRPIRATIDLSALRHNFNVARRVAGPTRLWSVLKANAYGHGLVRCALALRDQTDGYAMLDLDAAVRLRGSGLRHPILLLEGFYSPQDIPLITEYGLTSVVHSREQIAMLRSTKLHGGIPVYLKFNTGMNRLGLRPEALVDILAELRAIPAVGEIVLMTHFADADIARGIAEQLARFDAMAAGRGLPVCIANSATLLRFPEARRDWSRPGIMLYGSSPFADQSAADLDLRPVMTLNSEIIGVQEIQPGERVGYGGIFTAAAPTRVGIVACGYADGYPRHAVTGTPILVDGRRTSTLGRVSMDKLAVDLTALPTAGVGSRVVMWGEGMPPEEVAAAAGTISYELFCALAPRVPVTTIGADGQV